ncbi:putative fungistatic metabolite [Echria macrotheca]|uniref:Fungistatic metabolite n=1 Tax=Echria macrotheca TaxID=438768 RepID=A0AAJ0BK00_9PEZI|nr:putative fungistatic metabolite [Echria macrotheca]
MASTRSAIRATLSLFLLTGAVSALPSSRRTDEPYSHLGCYAGKTNGARVLNGAQTASDTMTVATCAAFCADYKYFGLEFGRECYCGNNVQDAGAAAPSADDPSAACTFTCPGDETGQTTCGAADVQDVYINNAYTPRVPDQSLSVPYRGCFVDHGNPRVLPDNLLGADDMTAEKCAAHCSDFSYFGLEFGRECWCGNAAPATPAKETDCDFPCAGDDRTLCGGRNFINVWGAPVASPETVAGGAASPSLTGRTCAAACSGYAWFGVEYGTQCFCGTALRDSAAERPQAECAMRCGGDYGDVCGDADRMNVFWSGVEQIVTNLDEVEGFHYQGCWTDDTAQRTLADDVLRADDMTVEKCAAFCQGYEYFGLEYASQCFCGNYLGGWVAPEEECSQLCAGDNNQWCGAPDRLSLYVVAEVCYPDS